MVSVPLALPARRATAVEISSLTEVFVGIFVDSLS
jgi:hypothetical protein